MPQWQRTIWSCWVRRAMCAVADFTVGPQSHSHASFFGPLLLQRRPLKASTQTRAFDSALKREEARRFGRVSECGIVLRRPTGIPHRL